MLVKALYDNWKKLVDKMNAKGVPLPTVRDPKTGIGSISLTLVFASSMLLIIGIMGKWTKIGGDIDMNNAMEFFYTSCALYFGRQWQTKSGSKLDAPADSTQPPAPPGQ